MWGRGDGKMFRESRINPKVHKTQSTELMPQQGRIIQQVNKSFVKHVQKENGPVAWGSLEIFSQNLMLELHLER